VAIGVSSGQLSSGYGSVAIGVSSGQVSTGYGSVAIGASSGQLSSGYGAVAIGASSGQVSSGYGAVAIGVSSGQVSSGYGAVAIGVSSGQVSSGYGSVAIGLSAGQVSSGYGSIAIGYNAGQRGQGAYSIAIGVDAASSYQHEKTIVLNAQDVPLNTTHTLAFYVAPIRNSNTGPNLLYYNPDSSEVTYGSINEHNPPLLGSVIPITLPATYRLSSRDANSYFMLTPSDTSSSIRFLVDNTFLSGMFIFVKNVDRQHRNIEVFFENTDVSTLYPPQPNTNGSLCILQLNNTNMTLF
jgi:hypothetical protein